MFRLPPLHDMRSSIKAEHSRGAGDLSVSRSCEQTQMPTGGVGRPNYSGSHRDLSYEEPPLCYTSNSRTFGLGVRDSGVSQDKTAFVSCDGLYNFKVMPYGLCNSWGTFERLMELILAGLH